MILSGSIIHLLQVEEGSDKVLEHKKIITDTMFQIHSMVMG
jgi:hypothetical protein